MSDKKKVSVKRADLLDAIMEFAETSRIPEISATLAFQDQSMRMLAELDPFVAIEMLQLALDKMHCKITENEYYDRHLILQDRFHAADYYQPAFTKLN
jgi:hypothetical protein